MGLAITLALAVALVAALVAWQRARGDAEVLGETCQQLLEDVRRLEIEKRNLGTALAVCNRRLDEGVW